MVTVSSGELDLVSWSVEYFQELKRAYEKLGPSSGVMTLDLPFELRMTITDWDVAKGSGCDILAVVASQPVVKVNCIQSSEQLVWSTNEYSDATNWVSVIGTDRGEDVPA